MPKTAKKSPTERIIAALQDDLAVFGEEIITWSDEALAKHLAQPVDADELKSSELQHCLDAMFPDRVNGRLYKDLTSYDIFDY